MSKKRQTPAPVPARLLAHLRRWVRLKIAKEFFVEWGGKPIKRVSKGFRHGVKLAGLSTQDGRVVPHTLRHTAATWLMQAGVDLWTAAGFLGMTVETLERNYGHHHPDHMKDAADALSRGPRKTTNSVVVSVVDKMAVRETAGKIGRSGRI